MTDRRPFFFLRDAFFHNQTMPIDGVFNFIFVPLLLKDQILFIVDECEII